MTMRILRLEAVRANAIVCGLVKFANLWLLPPPTMVGTRVGIHAESVDDAWYSWFFRERLGIAVPMVRRGPLGTVRVERVAEPGEFGRSSFGPAVWVFSEPKLETISGKVFGADYSDQPHVKERDRVALASARKESE